MSKFFFYKDGNDSFDGVVGGGGTVKYLHGPVWKSWQSEPKVQTAAQAYHKPHNFTSNFSRSRIWTIEAPPMAACTSLPSFFSQWWADPWRSSSPLPFEISNETPATTTPDSASAPPLTSRALPPPISKNLSRVCCLPLHYHVLFFFLLQLYPEIWVHSCLLSLLGGIKMLSLIYPTKSCSAWRSRMCSIGSTRWLGIFRRFHRITSPASSRACVPIWVYSSRTLIVCLVLLLLRPTMARRLSPTTLCRIAMPSKSIPFAFSLLPYRRSPIPALVVPLSRSVSLPLAFCHTVTVVMFLLICIAVIYSLV